VAFNGDNFLVVWRSYGPCQKGAPIGHGQYRVYGARVAPDGKVVDSKSLALGPDLHWSITTCEPPRVASAGGKWLVCWGACGNMPPGSFPCAVCGLFVATVAADGKSTMSQPIKDNATVGGVQAPVTVISNGKDGYFISWSACPRGGRDCGSGYPYGAASFDLDGKQTGSTELGRKHATPIRMPAAAWDGKGYLMVYWRANSMSPNYGFPEHTNQVVAHLVAADGKYEGATEVSSGKPNPTCAPAACGDGKGNTLVVYERHPDKAGETILVAAKLVKR
jgi:hypothetical protein